MPNITTNHAITYTDTPPVNFHETLRKLLLSFSPVYNNCPKRRRRGEEDVLLQCGRSELMRDKTNREEKSLHHVAIVTKCLDDIKPKTSVVK